MDEWERRTLSSISFEMEEHKRFSWVIWCLWRYGEDEEEKEGERKMKKRHKYAQKISLCSCICHVYVFKIRVRKAFTSSLRAINHLLQWNKNSHFFVIKEITWKILPFRKIIFISSQSSEKKLSCDGSERIMRRTVPYKFLLLTWPRHFPYPLLSDEHFAFAPTKYFPYQRPSKKRRRRKYSKRFSDEFEAVFLPSNPQHCSSSQNIILFRLHTWGPKISHF